MSSMLELSGSEVFTPFDHEAISLGYHPSRAYNRSCEQKVRRSILITEAQLRQQQKKFKHVVFAGCLGRWLRVVKGSA